LLVKWKLQKTIMGILYRQVHPIIRENMTPPGTTNTARPSNNRVNDKTLPVQLFHVV